MPGKSRKRTPSRRPTDQVAPAQTNEVATAGVLSQRTPATPQSAGPRNLLLYWIGGAIVLLVVLYVGALVFTPGLLPSWLLLNKSQTPPVSGEQLPGTPQPGAAGGRISFIRASQNSTKRDVFVVNADGSNQQQLTHDIYVEGGATWSPDGTKLVVQASVSGVSTVVLLPVNSDNSPGTAVQLTADVKADSVLPVWSPDGSKIAFQSKRGGGDYQVYVMDADGNNKKLLSDGKGYAGQPTWSPDGKSVAYVEGADSTAGSVREVDVASVDGGTPQQITKLNTNLGHPIWSPNGDFVSFLQSVDQYDQRILMVKPDGTGEQTLIKGGLNSTQSFSPDGTYLTYYKVDPTSGENVYKATVADSKETSLTAGGSGNYLSTWSPDGKQLAWASRASNGANYRIVVANADGTNLHAVSQGDGDDYQPSWSLTK